MASREEKRCDKCNTVLGRSPMTCLSCTLQSRTKPVSTIDGFVLQRRGVSSNRWSIDFDLLDHDVVYLDAELAQQEANILNYVMKKENVGMLTREVYHVAHVKLLISGDTFTILPTHPPFHLDTASYFSPHRAFKRPRDAEEADDNPPSKLPKTDLFIDSDQAK